MKKYLVILMMVFLLPAAILAAEEKTKDPNQLFYKANAYYENRDYTKALECYTDILDTGIESGNLYYNIGNGFIKMGKIGYAILSYEKAKRLKPGDSDLKSNLDYARSLVESASYQVPSKRLITRIIERPFRDISIKTTALVVSAFYIIAVLLLIISLINKVFASRTRYITIVLLVTFLYGLAAFSMRYYNEEILKHGIVVQKEAECKYEPIDKSTTYYTLNEGSEVLILKTKGDWRQIKRLDGKIAWVKKEAIEQI